MSIVGDDGSASFHHPDCLRSFIPDKKYVGHHVDNVPATVPDHVFVFFLRHKT